MPAVGAVTVVELMVPLAVTAELQHPLAFFARTYTLYVPAVVVVVYEFAEFVVSVPVAELTQ